MCKPTYEELESRVAELNQSLLESELRFKKYIENATDAIFIAQDEKIKHPNQKTLEILGYKDAQSEMLPFVQHIHPEDRSMVLDMHRRRLNGDRHLPTTYTFRIITHSKEARTVELNNVTIDWEGRLATLNFVRDITAQKQIENNLLEAHKMDAIGTLAGGIAHDFNNILMGIQGHTSLMLLDALPGSDCYRHLRGIEVYVNSGADLTSQLLGFARGGKYKAKPISLNTLVGTSSRLFGRTKKEIEIHCKLEDGLWSVKADRKQIEQVLINIYVNASQAMPDGGELYIQTANVILDESYVKPFQLIPGNYVKIAITDTGVGMDKETQQKIFEPFFTTNPMGRGTGLGLASAYGIVKNHNGAINVYSEISKGTTLTIYLPASDDPGEAMDDAVNTYLSGREAILLVDDEVMVLDVGRQMIKRLGYTVYVAESGEKAVEMFERHKDVIQLVILDMIMPSMTGGETFNRLKKISPDIKVLLSSGYSINAQATNILNRGCCGFIQKPFNLQELSQKLREVLDAS